MHGLDQPYQPLADAFVAERLSAAAMVRRARVVLGGEWSGLRRLVARVLARFGVDSWPRFVEVERFLRADLPLRRAIVRGRVFIKGCSLESPRFSPAAGAPSSWEPPRLSTIGELASFLGVTPRELDGLTASAVRFDRAHYLRRWIRKRSGRWRLLEAPRPRLKAVQRVVLEEVLNTIPAHPAACGFVAGLSVRDFVAPHVGRPVVMRLDLHDFFPSIRRARVVAMFMTVGYPEEVARTLADLCTCEVPPSAWALADAPDAGMGRAVYRSRHLPQGAPTSPAIANLCAFRMDLRLKGLADAAGARFTRYADDLAFSGDADVARRAGRFLEHAAAIVMEEGFSVNHRKTRVQRAAVRQQLAGVVINVRPGVLRAERDRLKAVLHRVAIHGPAHENRDQHPDFRAHLRGKIAWVASLNPAQGAKLLRRFDQIRW